MKLSFLLLMLALLAACDPQKADWGLGAIDTMPTPPEDPRAQCGVSLPVDVTALTKQRAACAFGTGALASATLGINKTMMSEIPIRHVIVLMKENRSFDHLFGKLHEQGQPDAEAVPPSWSNPDTLGVAVAPFHQTNTCLARDPPHQSAAMQVCQDGGKMDGFVRNAAVSASDDDPVPNDGHFAMGEYEQTDLPFNYWLANTFALSDRHFAPLPGGTYGNRNFLLFGDNVGIVDTGIVFPPPNTPNLLHLLMNAGFTWGAYSDSEPFSGALDWQAGDPGVHSMQDFYVRLATGTLPNVAFVDAREYLEDDHPNADLQVGEAWTRNIVVRAMQSPQWQRLVILWTYDESGAFADHVTPPSACRPVPDSPQVVMGARVPLVAISPWAKRHYVSHVVHDHTAILRFVEVLFGLPALTARDANSDALLDLFDFSCGRDLSVAVPPPAGTGSCVNPGPHLSH